MVLTIIMHKLLMKIYEENTLFAGLVADAYLNLIHV